MVLTLPLLVFLLAFVLFNGLRRWLERIGLGRLPGVGPVLPSRLRYVLSFAVIGAGGRGVDNITDLRSENIVALCDVDWERAAKTFAKYPDVPRYKDFRIMLEKQKDIDAVTVGTPDHFHAVAALAATPRDADFAASWQILNYSNWLNQGNEKMELLTAVKVVALFLAEWCGVAE